ncbi:VWA domain-containing protein [Acidianus sp. HS-5]|uniref:VWA domain-containing protein n=1 Tax=Acidianus sp. HS-5 TaxID=2886040 RepID=UPI001F221026|nr:VWA domain-containing protein [Acidianus sp. HS-5]BDC18788.1 hypothetical protein HS5_16780 [Acidianus sp. HS-5]
MAISTKVEFSHAFSFNSPVKAVFKITIVPEKKTKATGFHYIILLDNSLSMEGEKLKTAKRGAINLLNSIPEGNKVTFITFSKVVRVISEFSDAISIIPHIDGITVEPATALYKALNTAIQIAEKYGNPGFIILLTDGEPTDVVEPEPYENLRFPPGFKAISIGIGGDYKEQILKILVDKTGGLLYHIDNPWEVANVLPQLAVKEIGAKDVRVEIDSATPVKLLNYQGPPVRLGAIEGAIKVLGEVEIPSYYQGRLMTVKFTYEDPEGGRKYLETPVQITPARDPSTFLSGVNKDLLLEYRYYSLMNNLVLEINTSNLAEVTKTINEIQEITQQTENVDLVETTRKLQRSLETKDINSASKEITSEVTRKLRSA